MKKIILLPAFILLAVLITKAQPDSVQVKFITLPDSTGIGVPDGKLISKTIGAAGGQIISEDGKVELIFPADALLNETEISIQPVTNLAPNGSGKAYQFEPSGLQFKKPVQIIFHYTDEEAEYCPADMMGMAMQDSKGKWSFFDYDRWDSTAKTLRGTIAHFSAATNVAIMKLNPLFARISVNQRLFLEIYDISKKFPEGGYQWAEISKTIPRVWYANDIQNGSSITGKVKPGTESKFTSEEKGFSNVYAEYFAPDKIPEDNPVIVKVELSIKKGTMDLIKTFTCKVFIYDAYEIKVIGIMDNTNLPPIGTFKATDTSAIIIEFETKNVLAVGEIRNTLLKFIKVNTPKGCEFKFVNETTCKGPIDIKGLKSFKPLDRGTRAEIEFLPTTGNSPSIQWVCPKSGQPPAPAFSFPAYPNKINFELKDGEQVFEQKGFVDELKVRILVKRYKKE